MITFSLALLLTFLTVGVVARLLTCLSSEVLVYLLTRSIARLLAEAGDALLALATYMLCSLA